ncbi:hypothetical protein CRV02_08305 [Arcobacter sp. CECT 8989]|nr:hypothetical protein CRV02_08305 [Arcobacter sp. CECT 8989]
MCDLKYSDSELKCPICGNTYFNSKTGRTKEYCSTTCKNINSWLSQIENFSNNNNMTLESKREFRSRLTRIGNNIYLPRKKS